ncbi:hypothetical protein BDV06DRAFT_227038 [Aspergillus oleicola]
MSDVRNDTPSSTGEDNSDRAERLIGAFIEGDPANGAGGSIDSNPPAETPPEPVEQRPAKIDVPQFINQFCDIIDATPSNGTFCTSRSSDLVLNPGLEIEGFGQIVISVSPDHVKAIERIGREIQLPTRFSGAGQPSGTFELGGEAFGCRNPSWILQVLMFVRDAVDGLDLAVSPAEVQAQPYKCLLSRAGSGFVPQESDQKDGIFGTLAICLPLKHGVSAFDFSWAAWSIFSSLYASPVTSGHRLLLMYNLVHPPSARKLSTQEAGPGQLKDYLRKWSDWSTKMTTCFHREGLPPSEWVSTVFPPDESEPDLDLVINFGFPLWEERTETGYRVSSFAHGHVSSAGHGRSRGITLRNVIDTDGDIFIDSSKANARLCAYNVFLDSEPDEVHLGAYTSDDNPPRFVQTSRHTIAIIIPRSFYIPFLLHAAKHGRMPIGDTLNYLQDKFYASPQDETLRSQLKEICHIIIKNDSWLRELWENVAGSVIELSEYELTARALDGAGEIDKDLTQLIRDAVHRDGVERLQPVLDQFLKPHFVSTAAHIEMLLWLAEPSMEGCLPHTPGKTANWHRIATNTLFDRLETQTNVAGDEGSLLGRIVASVPDADFANRLIRIVQKKISSTDFVS